jgi:hypothetical protein
VRWPPAWELVSPDGKDVSMEDEESPSVGSVSRQRLVESVAD